MGKSYKGKAKGGKLKGEKMVTGATIGRPGTGGQARMVEHSLAKEGKGI